MWLFRNTTPKSLCDETVQFENQDEEGNNTYKNTPTIVEKVLNVKTFDTLKERIVNVKKIHLKIESLQEQKKRINKYKSTTTPIYDEDHEKGKSVNESIDNKINAYTLNDITGQLTFFDEKIRNISTEISRLSSIVSEQKSNKETLCGQSSIKTRTSDCLKLLNTNALNTDVVHESNLPPSQSILIKPKNDEKGIIPSVKREILKKPSFNTSKKSLKKKISGSKKKKNESIKKVEPKSENDTNASKIERKSDSNSIDEHKKIITEEVLSCFVENIDQVLKNMCSAQETERSEILVNFSKLENQMKTNENHIETLMCQLKQLNPKISVEHVQNRLNVKIENDQKNDLITEKSIDKQNECMRKTDCNAQSQKSIHEIPIVDSNNNNNTCDNLNACVCKLIKNEVTNTQSVGLSGNVNDDKITLGMFFRLKYTREQNNSCDDMCPIATRNIQENKSNNQNNNNCDCLKKLNSHSKHDDAINNCTAVNSANKTRSIVCVKNDNICTYLQSQPTPEWIKLLKQNVKINMTEDQYQQTLNQPNQISNNSQHGNNINLCEVTVNKIPQTSSQCQPTTDQFPEATTDKCVQTTQYSLHTIDQYQQVKKHPTQTFNEVQKTNESIDQHSKSTEDKFVQTTNQSPKITTDQCLQTTNRSSNIRTDQCLQTKSVQPPLQASNNCSQIKSIGSSMPNPKCSRIKNNQIHAKDNSSYKNQNMVFKIKPNNDYKPSSDISTYIMFEDLHNWSK